MLSPLTIHLAHSLIQIYMDEAETARKVRQAQPLNPKRIRLMFWRKRLVKPALQD
jgi:hypothetical protein